jgi:hypothetical protein
MVKWRMRALRSALVLALTAALCSPGFAASTSPPVAADEVFVMSSLGGFRLANQPGYTLRFESDGFAIYDGVLDGRDGHYTAPMSFAAVEAAVAQAHLCERNGVALFIAPNAHGTLGVPGVHDAVASDAITVRCGTKLKTFDSAVAPDLPAVAEQLLDLSKSLAWHYDGPAQRVAVTHFAR